MKTVVLGATGGLGRNVVEAAARAGHNVRAFVRQLRGDPLPPDVARFATWPVKRGDESQYDYGAAITSVGLASDLEFAVELEGLDIVGLCPPHPAAFSCAVFPDRLLSAIQASKPPYRLAFPRQSGLRGYEPTHAIAMRPFKGVAAEEGARLVPADYKGFHVLQDSRIIDLRRWNPNSAGKTDTASLVYGFRRLKVQKAESQGNEVFRIIALATHPDSQFRFPPQRLQPKLRRMFVETPNAQEKTCQFEVSVDLSKAPTKQIVDVIYEHYSPGAFVQSGEISTTIAFRSEFDAAEVTRWILLPSGREYRSFEILRYETGKPATAEIVKGYTEYLADDSSIIAYKMATVKAGHTFEVTWFYK
jgi:hypothetical protein